LTFEKEVFKKSIPDYNKLVEYGFILKNKEYIFEKNFMDDEFRANIKISLDGDITGIVYDLESNDEYLPLRVENSQGAFVGEVRDAYKNILIDIRKNCFVEKYFVSPQSNRIAELIINKYGDKPVFMWEKFPDFGVFKNSKTDKWYALIMNINRSKLIENAVGNFDVLNLKLDKEKIPELIRKNGIYPAYHMNKKYWVSVSLDETLKDEEILKFIDESYSYT